MNKFIVFEGPDGCGKSTILDMVYEYYRDRHMPVIKTREPGGTELGEEIRQVVLNSDMGISPMTEAFLMATSRSQLVDELIKPSLEDYNVLSDRFVPSSIVYQGIGRGLGMDQVKILNDLAIKDLRPDLTLYFSLSFESTGKRKNKRGSTDNIESAGDPFHRRIHEGYEIVYNKYKEYYNIVKIDAEPPIDEVFSCVIDLIERGGE